VDKRYVAPALACLALAVPASASAHARSPTVALDYRLVLGTETRALPGISVSILDGDRTLRLRSGSRLVTVLGDLREPMLRIGPGGTWVDRSSATATAQRLAEAGRAWKRVHGGSSFAWHDHRLAPPPYGSGRPGPAATFSIPILVDGRPAVIRGTFVRYARPSLWPWLAVAASTVVAALLTARRRPAWRRWLAIGLGAAGGVAAIVALATFGAADSPSGGVAWGGIALAAVVGGAAAVALVRLDGEGRIQLAGLVGLAAAATSIGSLGVFRHGVVISVLPAPVARVLCLTALAGGLAAGATGLLTDERPS
jgi:hypothetical protein